MVKFLDKCNKCGVRDWKDLKRIEYDDFKQFGIMPTEFKICPARETGERCCLLPVTCSFLNWLHIFTVGLCNKFLPTQIHLK